MKCANCENDAHYVYQITKDTIHLFCTKHVPGFLKDRKDAGLLPTTAEYTAMIGEARAAIGKVPTALTENLTEPTPKTVKKTTKKSAE